MSGLGKAIVAVIVASGLWLGAHRVPEGFVAVYYVGGALSDTTSGQLYAGGHAYVHYSPAKSE